MRRLIRMIRSFTPVGPAIYRYSWNYSCDGYLSLLVISECYESMCDGMKSCADARCYWLDARDLFSP